MTIPPSVYLILSLLVLAYAFILVLHMRPRPHEAGIWRLRSSGGRDEHILATPEQAQAACAVAAFKGEVASANWVREATKEELLALSPRRSGPGRRTGG